MSFNRSNVSVASDMDMQQNTAEVQTIPALDAELKGIRRSNARIPLCFHCSRSHYSNGRYCNEYKIEKEILAAQHRERTSRIEATEIVRSKISEGEKPHSAATRKKTCSENQGNKTPRSQTESEQVVQRHQAISIDQGTKSNSPQIE